jgi:hypothetical protein
LKSGTVASRGTTVSPTIPGANLLGPFNTDGLLIRNGRLAVPTDGTDEALIADLTREAHDQISSAPPGQSKTARILAQRYY